MNYLNLAQRRHTAKAYDPTRKIPAEVIERLLSALRLAPSSVNLQPWHFLVTDTEHGKQRIAKAAAGEFLYNRPKMLDASHVVVFCVMNEISDEHIERVLDREEEDGRFRIPGARDAQRATRMTFVDLHRGDAASVRAWAENQVFIALGMFLLAAAAEGIDATPMEGFSHAILDREFGLAARGIASVAVVALGHRSERDFNAALPKSRLPNEEVFTFA